MRVRTAGRRGARLAFALLGAGCDTGGDRVDAGREAAAAGESRREVLRALGEAAVLPSYREFHARTEDLVDACDALAARPDGTAEWKAAREAWRRAARIWQRAEVMQFGPAGAMASVAGGQDLRDQIYSWPLVNPCRVDQELVEGRYEDADAFAGEPVNVRGLDALEYLLFREDTGTECGSASFLADWDMIAQELPERRAHYARTLAVDLERRARTLREAWEPDAGDFLSALANAGDGSDAYPTAQAALNAISDAMFYAEKETKDMKLGQAAGIVECAVPPCFEARWAEFSREAIVANYEGLGKLLFGAGADGLGFDDLLADIGMESLSDRMRRELDALLSALAAIEPSLEAAAERDPASVEAAYAAAADLMTTFKTQFVSVLDLELPLRAAADND